MKISEINTINNLPFFTTEFIRATFPNEKKIGIWMQLSRLEKKGKIKRMKRGLYITEKSYEINKSSEEYKRAIGCQMKNPSYVTAETILSDFDILSEGTYVYTYVTLKAGALISNIFGQYSYKRIQRPLFIGYKIKQYLGMEYYEATKAKALFDFLYLRSRIIPSNIKNINLVEELRLKMETFNEQDWEELFLYAKIDGGKKMTEIISNIYKNASNNSKT